MPVRIAHISDTHLGTRPRRGVKQHVWGEEMRSQLLENDFYDRFRELFDRISELDPPVDAVVHSGDLYNSPWEGNPSQPPAVAREVAITVLKEFIEKTGIPVLIIEGNHGLYRSLEVSLLTSLKLAVPGLDVVTQQDLKQAFAKGESLIYSYGDLDIFCFPFMEYSVLESANAVNDFFDWISTHQTPSSSRLSIGVAHGMDIDRTLFSPIFSMGYDYIALGHDHHQHKHAKNAWYAGSPERWRFDETRHEKGFLLIELEDGKQTKIEPQTLVYERPVYNDVLAIEQDETVESMMSKVEAWLEEHGLRADWDPSTSARVRLVFEGVSTDLSTYELTMALETFRQEALERDSEFNIAQFVWTIRHQEVEYDAAAYPEIESEYLIEDPEKDFKAYLSESQQVDEKFNPEMLTKIAVKALKVAISDSDEKLKLEDLTEDEG
jgi:DNA repair exonuclease SbcCD nuclease subunit